MITSDVKDQSQALSQEADISSAARFLVPVPYIEADLTPVARRLWQLANATGAHVTFLGLCNDEAQALSLRRTLATVTAMLNSGSVTADSQVLVGKNSVSAIRSSCRAGDLVVCFAEPRQSLLRRPLGQILKSDLQLPLYILSDVYPQKKSGAGWRTQAAAWAGSLAIIAGFFLFQIRADAIVQSWSTVLQLVSLPVEVWLIIAWNSLLG